MARSEDAWPTSSKTPCPTGWLQFGFSATGSGAAVISAALLLTSPDKRRIFCAAIKNLRGVRGDKRTCDKSLAARRRTSNLHHKTPAAALDVFDKMPKKVKYMTGVPFKAGEAFRFHTGRAALLGFNIALWFILAGLIAKL